MFYPLLLSKASFFVKFRLTLRVGSIIFITDNYFYVL